jgi:hypothetical protein
MRLTTFFVTAAAACVIAAAASAGSLTPEVMEAPVTVIEAAPAGSSVPSSFVVAGILTALVVAAAANQ